MKELLNVRNEEGSTEILSAAIDLHICTDNFTLDELRKAINKMKPNKSFDTNFVFTLETLKFVEMSYIMLRLISVTLEYHHSGLEA